MYDDFEDYYEPSPIDELYGQMKEMLKKDVVTKIEHLNATITSKERRNDEQKTKITELKKEIKELEKSNKVNGFGSLLKGKINKDNVEEFAKNILVELEGQSYGGMDYEKVDITLKLLVKHYPDRGLLFEIFDVFEIEYKKDLKNFIHPRFYTKEMLQELKWTNPGYNTFNITNGCILEDNYGFWLYGRRKLPLQELMKNENFPAILKDIASQMYNDEKYLLYLDTYHKLSDENCKIVDDIAFKHDANNYKSASNYILRNFERLIKLDDWKEKLFKRIKTNSYSDFYINKYPLAMQIEYLKTLPYSQALSASSDLYKGAALKLAIKLIDSVSFTEEDILELEKANEPVEKETKRKRH